jgi:predicted chitinase
MGAIKDKANFVHLAGISSPVPVNTLNKNQLTELQTGLSLLGYPIGDIDGEFGPKTRNAWAEFKTGAFPGNPTLVAAESIATLRDKVLKIAVFDDADFSSKDSTIKAIKGQCQAMGIGLPTQVAYVLATAQWETAQTFKPVKEAFWLSEEWRKNNLSYYPYYGRGYVQLTWKANYKKYSDLLGVNMVDNPDQAMRPEIALFVLVHGFKVGTFTGRKITDFITAERTDFLGARSCINGEDQKDKIAALAQNFLAMA